MEAIYPQQKKHKAKHRGYKKKPTKKEVNALMGMYAAIGTTTTLKPVMKKEGVQLKLF